VSRSTHELVPSEAVETVIRPPAFAPSALIGGLGTLAAHGDLLYTLTVHRIRVRYKQSVLGLAWAVLQPLATMLVLTVVFSYIARVPTAGLPYGVFALAGLVPWTCFSNALTTATQSLVSHASLVTRVYFPREILPLTYVAAAVLDAAIAGIVLAVFMAYHGLPFVANPLLAAAALVVLVALVTGLALVLSASQVRVRDIGVAMPIVLQLLMFASPVAYGLDTVPARVRPWYVLNPLAGIIENFRRALVGTAPADLHALAISTAWACVLLPLGYAYFKRVEATAADVV